MADRKETITETIATRVLQPTKENIEAAGAVIRRGGLVAFPTETVFGLGADALNAAAVKKVYEAKGRPSDNPMIVHIAAAPELAALTDQHDGMLEQITRAFWPGPLTVVVRKRSVVPATTTGGLDTVAVRNPESTIARELIRASGTPIAAPSANISGRPSPTKTEHVIHDLQGKIDVILSGPDCRVGIESTVLDMSEGHPVILRPGIITPEEIGAVCGQTAELDPTLRQRPTEEERRDPAQFHPKAPGMKYKHYAPQAEMVIFEGSPSAVRRRIEEAKAAQEQAGKKVGVILFGEHDFARAAHDLFADLRRQDEEGVDLILAGALSDQNSVGFAVMNRMLKSAGYHVIKV